MKKIRVDGSRKRRATMWAALAFFLAAPVSHAAETTTADRASTSAERTQWFRDAKFGMFIHWGLYSIPAGEWNGRKVAEGKNGEWIMKFLKIPAVENRKFAAEFNPVRFDADEWVGLAKAAGMKYVIITAKHHDGFAMYHSKASAYNIVDATPFKRDPMTELAAACRREGLKFCFYYSHAEDWDHPDAIGNEWDYLDEAKKDFERYLNEKSIPQVKELLTNYGPLGVMWFDRGIPTEEQGLRFADIVHKLQPDCLVNGRVGNYQQDLLGDYQEMSDNGMPDGGIEELWETPQTLNNTWGYRKDDNRWKSSEVVIRKLVEIVSKGGNYLLNVGPTAEGVIPAPSVQILREVGAWVDRNGESIYGTTASPFTSLPWGRCTVKGERLYLHVLDWPADGRLAVPGLKNQARRAWLLADPAGRQLPVEREGNCLSIRLPAAAPDPVDTVVVLEIEGRPDVEPVVVKAGEGGAINLDTISAKTTGRAIKRFNRKGKYHIGRWTGPGDAVTWTIQIERAGPFRVNIQYSALPEWKGRECTVTVADEMLTARVEETGKVYEYQKFELGVVKFPKAGTYTLTVRPKTVSDQPLMYLQSVGLEPAAQ